MDILKDQIRHLDEDSAMSDGDFEDEKYSLADTLADMKETKKI